MGEKNSMSPQEMLDLIDRKAEIIHATKKLLPKDIWKNKFEVSRKKNYEEINSLVFSYMISEMVRSVPSYCLEDGTTSVEAYILFVKSLFQKYQLRIRKAINHASVLQRKRMLMAIREEMMEEESQYCLKQNGMGEKNVG